MEINVFLNKDILKLSRLKKSLLKTFINYLQTLHIHYTTFHPQFVQGFFLAAMFYIDIFTAMNNR